MQVTACRRVTGGDSSWHFFGQCERLLIVSCPSDMARVALTVSLLSRVTRCSELVSYSARPGSGASHLSREAEERAGGGTREPARAGTMLEDTGPLGGRATDAYAARRRRPQGGGASACRQRILRAGRHESGVPVCFPVVAKVKPSV